VFPRSAGSPSSSHEMPRSAAHVFREVVSRHGCRTAVRHGPASVTYDELARQAGGIAAWLARHGVGRGDIVATLVDRSPRTVAAAMGSWAVGAAYAHIDPADPDSRIDRLLNTTAARAVLVDEHHHGRVSAGTAPVGVMGSALPPAPYEVREDLSPEDPAYLVFTSGSTGTPKAVEVQHRAILNHHTGFWNAVAPTTADSFGLATTFAADLGLNAVFGALLTGGRLDIYDRHTVLDDKAFAAELRAHPVDELSCPPSLLAMLAAHGDIGPVLPQRMLLVSGEAFPPHLAAALHKARPDLAVFNAYGPAEACVEMMIHRVREGDGRRARVPVGRPIGGVSVRLLDDHGERVPDGTPGVLFIGGACLARGYRGDSALTGRKFVTVDGERYYCTDDLMIRDPDGTYEYLGRTDRQIKIRGHRVEPAEVEAALLGSPGVRGALAVAQPAGLDAELELVAYVVGDCGPTQQLIARLRGVLPQALVPSRLHVVPAIAVTANGKADLAALALAARAADADAGAVAPEAHRPGTEDERFVASVWRTALGRPVIGYDQRFMEIGGDSFKALRVYAMLRRRYPDMSIGQIFDHPTVTALARALAGGFAPETGQATEVVEL
jgi:amino acid adenylation domain-containing protein